jgi:hypothetical protein
MMQAQLLCGSRSARPFLPRDPQAVLERPVPPVSLPVHSTLESTCAFFHAIDRCFQAHLSRLSLPMNHPLIVVQCASPRWSARTDVENSDTRYSVAADTVADLAPLDEVRFEHTAEIYLQSSVAAEADLVPWDQVYLDLLVQAPSKIYYR